LLGERRFLAELDPPSELQARLVLSTAGWQRPTLNTEKPGSMSTHSLPPRPQTNPALAADDRRRAVDEREADLTGGS
jgi:hypothetical protein